MFAAIQRKLLIKPSKAAIKRLRERLAAESRTLRGGNAMAVIAKLNPDHPGLGGLLPDSGVDQDVRRPGRLPVEAHLQVGHWRHADKPKRWIAGRYFGKFNKFRNDRWVFGDRDSGACLANSPGPASSGTCRSRAGHLPMTPPWPDTGRRRRQKVKPPLDSVHPAPAVQAGRAVPLCGDHLLTADQPPQSPESWERWFLRVTKKAITAGYLVHRDTPSAARSSRTHLVHDTCHRSRNQPRTARNTVIQQTN